MNTQNSSYGCSVKFVHIFSLLKCTYSPLWWKFDQWICSVILHTCSYSDFPFSCWPCPWQPCSSGKACVSGCTHVLSISSNHTETLPSLFLSPCSPPPFPSHSVLSFSPYPPQLPGCFVLGLWPVHLPSSPLTHPRLTAHTHLIQFLNVPIAAAAMAAALNRLHTRPSTFSSCNFFLFIFLKYDPDVLFIDWFLNLNSVFMTNYRNHTCTGVFWLCVYVKKPHAAEVMKSLCIER